MARRARLTKADREKRVAKRERRREAEPDRRKRREATRAASRRTAAAERYIAARKAYDALTAALARGDREPGVVCLSCGLEQRYVHGFEEDSPPTDRWGVVSCRRGELLDLPCDGLVCETAEAFAEAL